MLKVGKYQLKTPGAIPMFVDAIFVLYPQPSDWYDIGAACASVPVLTSQKLIRILHILIRIVCCIIWEACKYTIFHFDEFEVSQ
jgi:hypothetical protein